MEKIPNGTEIVLQANTNAAVSRLGGCGFGEAGQAVLDAGSAPYLLLEFGILGEAAEGGEKPLAAADDGVACGPSVAPQGAGCAK